MEYKDLKKLALLGIIGGMMVGAPAFADEHEEEKPKAEENGGGDSGGEEMSCSGKGGCPAKDKE